ncbi:cellulose biosynthesis protein BcsC [Sphingomonas sp. C3-2]|uniref:cellulose biosynthesis protein BcsC n=1 Tax=Sphingomonas sp. C3-2 TaxID=3062169 RepID=UPI00294B7B93|nr:cellulose synthase subunit BcsC-related outer membrane protein [Sphingomonas sp. C3-2]WOK35987.1 cellulose synthase subunit BcsC-related outer membrane protein [Sphingomonas sp. C3-2]
MRKSLTLAALVLLGTTALPAIVQAQTPAVNALLEQARYWQGKGRPDLASQAYRRVLAIDPANAVARRALAAPSRAPAPAPTPAAKPNAPASTAQPTPTAPRPATQASRPTPARPDRGGDARAAGFRALDAGNLKAAGQHFQAALARNPNDADALGGLGIVRLRSQNFIEAHDLLQRASRTGSAAKWAEALASARFFAGMAEAESAADAGRLTEAQEIAETLVASDFADKAPAFDLLGGIYERQGRYADAARLYTQAAGSGAGTAQGSVRARAIRAQALEAASVGNGAAAEQLFQRGMLADPKDPWIRYEFARFLEKQGRRADADAIMGALRSSSEPDALYAAALLLSQTNRPTDAEALLDRIPASARTGEMRSLALGIKADAAIARARALTAQGQGGQAMAALRQLADTPGLTLANRGALADALFDLGDSASASFIAQQALSEGGGDPEAYEPLVRVLAKSGQDAFAAAAVQRAAERAGDGAEAQRSVARLNAILAVTQADRLRLGGNYAQAFDVLQAQWNAAPGNIEILSALGRLYQAGGLYPQAAQTWQMVLNQSPADKDAMIGFIDAASAAGDHVRARQAAERLLSAHPTDYSVYMAAARMEQARGDERAALRYMKRARALYVGQTGGPARGGFTGTNPFASMAGGATPNPFVPAQPVNPFALGQRQPAAPFPVLPGTTMPGTVAIPAQPMTMAMESYPQPPSGFAPTARQAITDPVLQSIERDVQSLAADTGTRVDVTTHYRDRSGETGLSQLRELGGEAQVSTDFAGGRVSARAKAVVLDAGRPTGSGLARFGTNGLAEAAGIVLQQPSELAQADTQHASGVAVSVGYDSKLVQADVGTTPLGFEKTDISAGITVTPRLSRYATARIWAERRPVTDSVVSYAGTRDPLTAAVTQTPGVFWGAVMKSGGGISLSYDKDGSGVYADGSYYRYDGTHVRDNESYQVNIGGYLNLYRDMRQSLSFGVNVNYQDYANNQNFFSLGHGGYFSPQSFLSVSFPLRYARRDDRLDIAASLTPGYQSYDQSAAALFPMDSDAQDLLDYLKSVNSDVRARYDSASKTGFGMAAGASAYYRVTERTRIGGELNLNTFGDYNEFKSLLGIRQQLGGND